MCFVLHMVHTASWPWRAVLVSSPSQNWLTSFTNSLPWGLIYKTVRGIVTKNVRTYSQKPSFASSSGGGRGMPFLWAKLCSKPQAPIMRRTLAGWYKSLPALQEADGPLHLWPSTGMDVIVPMFLCTVLVQNRGENPASQGVSRSPSRQKIISYVKNHNVTFFLTHLEASHPAPRLPVVYSLHYCVSEYRNHVLHQANEPLCLLRSYGHHI